MNCLTNLFCSIVVLSPILAVAQPSLTKRAVFSFEIEKVLFKEDGQVDSVLLMLDTRKLPLRANENLELCSGRLCEATMERQCLLLHRVVPYKGMSKSYNVDTLDGIALWTFVPGPDLPFFLHFSARCASDGRKPPDTSDTYFLKDTLCWDFRLAPDGGDVAGEIDEVLEVGQEGQLKLEACFDHGSLADAIKRRIEELYWTYGDQKLTRPVVKVLAGSANASNCNFDNYKLRAYLLGQNRWDVEYTVQPIPDSDLGPLNSGCTWDPGWGRCLRFTVNYRLDSTFIPRLKAKLGLSEKFVSDSRSYEACCPKPLITRK